MIAGKYLPGFRRRPKLNAIISLQARLLCDSASVIAEVTLVSPRLAPQPARDYSAHEKCRAAGTPRNNETEVPLDRPIRQETGANRPVACHGWEPGRGRGKPTRDMLIGNMDVKLLIGAGDETTAKYCSEEIGKQFVRRESWGASVGGGGLVGGFPRASRSTQGRWELEAIMPSETLRRLDSKKSVLLMRSQYAAVLDKINFFNDGRYKKAVKAAAGFAARLNVPPVTEAITPTAEAALVTPSVDLRASWHKAAFDRVMAAAVEVFDDLTPFHSAFAAAMNERGSAAVAELCQRLRTEPETIAELKRRRSLGRTQHHEALTQNLRAEIIAARNALNADRAERAPAESATKGATNATDANGAIAVGDASAPLSLQTATDSSGAGGSIEAQNDVAKLIDAISEDTGSWTSEVKARVEATLREGSDRAAFEETMQSLRILDGDV